MFWLIVVGVVSLSIGFVMGATFRQYRRPLRDVASTQGLVGVAQAVSRLQRNR